MKSEFQSRCLIKSSLFCRAPRRRRKPERAGVVIKPGEGPKAAGGDAGRKLSPARAH